MKNVPPTIFLQIAGPGDLDVEMLESEDFEDCKHDATWCWHRIADTDIEYVLKAGD